MAEEIKPLEEEKIAAKKDEPEPVKGGKEKPKKTNKVKKENSIPDDTNIENKTEEVDMPEVTAEIVDDVEDEQELKEKLRDTKEKKKPKKIEDEIAEDIWIPKTKLGQKVSNGEITSLHEVMIQSTPIKEVGIVDKLLPDLQEEILDVGRVQRVTDSGRRMRFRVVAAVGNGDGYVGVGEAKGKEAGPTIRKSIERAKLNIKEVKRGCGSWECGCGTPHTVPFRVEGREGSVRVTLMPAPRGVGLVSGKIAKIILALAGVKDVWVMTDGHTRSGINFSRAVVKAIENTNYMKLKDGEEKRLNIVTGPAKPMQTQNVEVME